MKLLYLLFIVNSIATLHGAAKQLNQTPPAQAAPTLILSFVQQMNKESKRILPKKIASKNKRRKTFKQPASTLQHIAAPEENKSSDLEPQMDIKKAREHALALLNADLLHLTPQSPRSKQAALQELHSAFERLVLLEYQTSRSLLHPQLQEEKKQ